ncbi:MAG TPA: iron chelate uptake ABC transporter family permease subunit [Candidatus Binatia bacterium]|jgi:zinc/manganese transport system permease protein|nr:iron chelate uptake ABC transporter family permease subunit [Candidatus Binatia bacterium]
MISAIEFLWVPFLACLVLTGIHVYLGLHVLARGIIFVDLALAQVAALGITVALLAGHPLQSEAAYWYALAFTLAGSLLFAVSRTHRAPIPQEAIIGIVYAASAAIAILVIDRAPQGSEHIKQLLVGSILTVTLREVGTLALLYAIIGSLHWTIRRPLLEISFDPEAAVSKGRWVRGWDFVFYASFGFVVTSSVQIAGVLLVFSYLIVPAAIAALLVRSVSARLALGWGLGFVVSLLGLVASATWDLPTGATVVTTFGVSMAAVAACLGLRILIQATRAKGLSALTGAGIAALAVLALAGLLLVIVPQMDHHWLNWLEKAAPSVQLAFLTSDERETYRDSQEAVEQGQSEIQRLRAMQQQVQWGTREMSEELQERLRQYLASRSEITAGDQIVLKHLQSKARQRQRFWLGIPLLLIGTGGALTLARARR